MNALAQKASKFLMWSMVIFLLIFIGIALYLEGYKDGLKKCLEVEERLELYEKRYRACAHDSYRETIVNNTKQQ